jgi:hypothetical protein
VIPVLVRNSSRLEIISVEKNDASSVHIIFTGAKNEKITVKMLNPEGAEIMNASVIATQGINNIDANVPSLSTGIYFLTLSNDLQLYSKKILFLK